MERMRAEMAFCQKADTWRLGKAMRQWEAGAEQWRTEERAKEIEVELRNKVDSWLLEMPLEIPTVDDFLTMERLAEEAPWPPAPVYEKHVWKSLEVESQAEREMEGLRDQCATMERAIAALKKQTEADYASYKAKLAEEDREAERDSRREAARRSEPMGIMARESSRFVLRGSRGEKW